MFWGFRAPNAEFQKWSCGNARLESVCLSRRPYIGPKCGTDSPTKTKIGTQVDHFTRDSDNTFKINTSKANLKRSAAYCSSFPHSLLMATRKLHRAYAPGPTPMEINYHILLHAINIHSWHKPIIMCQCPVAARGFLQPNAKVRGACRSSNRQHPS